MLATGAKYTFHLHISHCPMKEDSSLPKRCLIKRLVLVIIISNAASFITYSRLFRAGNFCPVCLKVYRSDEKDLPMVCCDSCDRWIHTGTFLFYFTYFYP